MTPNTEVLRKAAIEEVARWIGQSGYVRHVPDHNRAWQHALSEAEGLLFDEYGAPTAANKALHALATADTAVAGERVKRPRCSDCSCCYAPKAMGLCGACDTDEFCENCGNDGPFDASKFAPRPAPQQPVGIDVGKVRERLVSIYSTVAYNRSTEADRTREVILIAEQLLDRLARLTEQEDDQA